MNSSRQEAKYDEWTNPSTSRTTDFSYLGLTDLVTKEVADKTFSSTTETTTKTYGYDAQGVRTSMVLNWPGGGVGQSLYGYDPQGNVSQLIKDNWSGGVRASYGYTPYGDVDKALTEGDDLTSETGDARLAPQNASRYQARKLRGELWIQDGDPAVFRDP